jgi:GntR family transcriptional regulator
MSASALDPGAALPLYHQLADTLRRRILSGDYPVDSNLPSEPQLMSTFSVSRVTARQAVGVLVSEGLVIRGSGRGTRVLPAAAAQVGQHFNGSLSELMQETKRAGVKDVRIERHAPLEERVRSALGLNAGHVVRVSRTRHLDGQIFAYSVDHLPEKVGNLIDEDTLERDSLMTILVESGIELASARQSIRADIADPEIAARLDLPQGAPVLTVSRVIFGPNKKPIDYVESYYRGDRYTYTVNLSLDNEGTDSLYKGLA